MKKHAEGIAVTELRSEIDRAIEAGDLSRAKSLLSTIWMTTPTLASAAFVVARFERLRAQLRLVPCRLAILRSFTVEPVLPILRAAAFVNGIDMEIYLSGFNTYAQDILDPTGPLYSFAPEAVVLAVQACDVAPSLWHDFADQKPGQIQDSVEKTSAFYRQLVEVFRARSSAHLIVHSLAAPTALAYGIFDGGRKDGQRASFARINEALYSIARTQKNTYVLDYAALAARHGHASWHDEAKWLTARMPIAASHLAHLAQEWLRFLHPAKGRVCKVLVTDLDNTLWGGVIGENGLDGIRLGLEYPDAAFIHLQRAILDLYCRGVILAIASKNNEDEALAAIDQHPAMLLRREHFAARRINWNDKAQSIREIATELGVGLDTIAFLDDNPVERQWVETQIPEITVIDLPADPMRFADTLRASPLFERLTLTHEDRERGRYYSEQRQRFEFRRQAASLEEFYHSLGMKTTIRQMSQQTLTRVAQLTQKTNQFNLTTRRYTEQQLLALEEHGWRIFIIELRDCFGDNGIVGVAIFRVQNEECEIDTFLLSCRVIGRTVETAFLVAIVEAASCANATRVIGRYIPTEKNGPSREFYRSHGFVCTVEQNREAVWQLNISNDRPLCPPWIEQGVVDEKEGQS